MAEHIRKRRQGLLGKSSKMVAEVAAPAGP
jgi:hypothetical protein